MNNKAFTLIEILTAITILAILSVITVTSVTHFVKSGKKDLNDIQTRNIKLASKAWVSDNKNIIKNSDNCIYITLKDLIDNGYYDDGVKNIKNDTDIDPESIYININNNDNNYSYDIGAKNDNCTHFVE